MTPTKYAVLIAAVFIVAPLGIPSDQAFARFAFQGIPGEYDATGVSANGSIVVGDSYVWTAAAGRQSLPPISGTDVYPSPSQINADGSVIVGSGAGTPDFHGESEAFRWTAAGGTVGLGDLPGGLVWSYALAVSGDGNVVVGASSANSSMGGQEAFRWTAATGMQPLGNAIYSEAYATNSDGSIVTGTSNDDVFRWTAATGMTTIRKSPNGTGGFLSGWGYGMTPDGSVIIGEGSVGPGGAFRWTLSGGAQSLGILPGGSYTEAHGVSADGSIVVGTADTGLPDSDPNDYQAFVWSNQNGMQSLASLLTAHGADLTGWVLNGAAAISADGTTIVGQGTFFGNDEAFVATVPEPASLAGAALALASIASLRRRRA